MCFCRQGEWNSPWVRKEYDERDHECMSHPICLRFALYNHVQATKHAEIVAISRICQEHENVDWSQVDLYVTVEPCIMCAAALRLLGIRRVFFGTHNERFGGCGSIISAHLNYMPDSVGTLEAILVESWRKPCVMALRRFYMRQNDRAPKPKTKRNRQLKDTDL